MIWCISRKCSFTHRSQSGDHIYSKMRQTIGVFIMGDYSIETTEDTQKFISLLVL